MNVNAETSQSNWLRVTAAGIAAITLLGLVIRLVLAADLHNGFLNGASHLYQFFTIVTNTLVLVVFSYVFFQRSFNPRWILTSVVSIVGVGLIFHFMLDAPPNTEFFDWLANILTHSVVPIACFIWWLAYGSVYNLHISAALWALVWPLAYCAYALIRAEFSGFYPYPFIDLERLGFAGLVKSVGFISCIFLTISLVSYFSPILLRKLGR